MTPSPAILLLENEEPIHGRAMGHPGKAAGVLVASAVASGFPELLTDPAYAGKMVCFTFPHVGNPGVVPDDLQSDRVHARAVIAREFNRIIANRLGVETMDGFLSRNRVPAVEDVDTRKITEIITRRGLVRAVLGCGEFADANALAKEFAAGPELWSPGRPGVTEPYGLSPASGATSAAAGMKVVVYDLGAKRGLLRRFAGLGCPVRVVPAGHSAEATLAEKPGGVVFSAGPGVPADWPEAVTAASGLLGKVPLFATGVGAGVVAAAAGAKIVVDGKAHFGGQPVRLDGTPLGEMTSQAHEFWVQADSLAEAGLGATHFNLNDRSLEGFMCGPRRIRGYLFHPEAEPGPRDSLHVFNEFAELMRTGI